MTTLREISEIQRTAHIAIPPTRRIKPVLRQTSDRKKANQHTPLHAQQSTRSKKSRRSIPKQNRPPRPKSSRAERIRLSIDTRTSAR
jgi:hypothetical protein